jgi:signal transduction histidine kinase
MSEALILLLDQTTPRRSALYDTLMSSPEFRNRVLTAETAKEGRALTAQHNIKIVISALQLSDADSNAILQELKNKPLQIEAILFADTQTQMETTKAFRAGAFDVLLPDEPAHRIVNMVRQALEKLEMRQRLAHLEQKVGKKHNVDNILGNAASIKNALESLEAESETGRMNLTQRKLVRQIKENNQRIFKIAAELLDLAQTANLQLKLTPVSPQVVVDYSLHALQFQAQQKKVHIETQIAHRLPTVEMDVEKTTWVMVNLLSNALRYSAEGGKIIVSIVEKPSLVVFSVKDQGRGISKILQESIFEKFFHSADGTTQSKVGVGLGLAISKDFIRAQGGDIWVESIEGEGATFSFSMPMV